MHDKIGLQRRFCVRCGSLVWAAFAAGAAAASHAAAASSDGSAPAGGIQDRVLTAMHAAPDALAAPLSADALTRAGSAGPLLPASPSATPVGLTIAAAEAEGAAAAAPIDGATPTARSAARNLPVTDGRSSARVLLPGATSLNDPDGLLDQPIVGNTDTPATIVYRSRPGDWLETSPRFSDRGIARKFDAQVGIAAGSGGALRTYASVTVPLIDNVLSVRISGAKGSGYPLGGGYRDAFREGPLQFNTSAAGDSSDFGFDLHWAPTDSFNLNLRTEQSSAQLRSGGRH